MSNAVIEQIIEDIKAIREQNNNITELLNAVILGNNQLLHETRRHSTLLEDDYCKLRTDVPKPSRTRKTATENKKSARNKKEIVEDVENNNDENDLDEIILTDTNGKKKEGEEKKKRAPAKKKEEGEEKKKRAPAKKKEPVEKKKRQTKAEKEAAKIAIDVIDLQTVVDAAEDS